MASKDRIFPKRKGIDFYHTYKEDLKLLAELGLKTYRTSINWALLLTLSGASAFMAPAVCRFANFLRGWADAVMIGFYFFSNASIRASKWLEMTRNITKK